MVDTICFVSLISGDNSPLYIQQFQDSSSITPGTEDTKQHDANTESDKDSKATATLEANKFLKYNFLSHMSLDIFESPFIDMLRKDTGGTSSLLFVQDGVSVYGYESSTGLKIVIGTETKENISVKLHDIFRAIYKSYLKIICNPFNNTTTNEKQIDLQQNTRFEQDLTKIINDYNKVNI